jgi:hypothetical protein
MMRTGEKRMLIQGNGGGASVEKWRRVTKANDGRAETGGKRTVPRRWRRVQARLVYCLAFLSFFPLGSLVRKSHYVVRTRRWGTGYICCMAEWQQLEQAPQSLSDFYCRLA